MFLLMTAAVIVALDKHLQADINDILSYQDAESPLPTADSGRMPESALSGARAFLKTAGRDLMDLVEGEIALLQGCLRRRLVLRDLQIRFEKNLRQMVIVVGFCFFAMRQLERIPEQTALF
jgi:hypothetical protein